MPRGVAVHSGLLLGSTDRAHDTGVGAWEGARCERLARTVLLLSSPKEVNANGEAWPAGQLETMHLTSGNLDGTFCPRERQHSVIDSATFLYGDHLGSMVSPRSGIWPAGASLTRAVSRAKAGVAFTRPRRHSSLLDPAKPALRLTSTNQAGHWQLGETVAQAVSGACGVMLEPEVETRPGLCL